MSQKYINIYASARIAKGLTQERAAELIGNSVESIRAYEGDVRIPPDETALRMADVYDAQYLAYQHLQRSVLGKRILPEIEPKDLPGAILNFLNEVRELVECQTDLIAIGADGVISPEERARWIQIMEQFMHVKKAILQVELSQARPAQ